MKATFNNSEFAKVLRDATRIVPTSTNKQVLKHVLIKADKDEDRVDVYASSEDMSIRRTLFQEVTNPPVTIKESGSCLLPAKELYEIVKNANGHVSLTNNNQPGKTEIAFGQTKYELSSLAPEQFTPYTDDPDETTTVVLLAPELSRLLRRTTFAVLKGESRPILTGVNLSLSDNSLTGTATDGLRLAQITVNCQSVSGNPRSIPVPATSLDKLVAALPSGDDDEEITLTLGPSSCTVSWGDDMNRMVMRGLDGVYPEVSRIIPQNPPFKAVLERQAFLDACERVSILSETEHQRAEFDIFLERVVVSTRSAQYGFAQDSVEMKSTTLTQKMQILSNINYWIALLRSYEGVEQIEIGLTDPIKPMTVKPVGGAGVGLIAPLMKASVDSQAA